MVMDLYRNQSSSWPQKLWILVCELALLAASYPILFGSWGVRFAGWMGWAPGEQLARHALVFAFSAVVFVRMSYMMLALLRRTIPLEEAFSIPLAFVVYYVGFPLFTLRAEHPLGAWAALAVALFVIGLLLNTVSEVQRARWKSRPENAGRLYTGGLFGWARHINYFGDVLWATGYAVLSRNPWAATVPALLLIFFAAYNVPKLDAHLREHYGADFESYARTTARLIPFVY